jgi:hypothetical protein
MPAARGEKIVRSVPRSRCTLSWPPSIVARISSSLIVGRGGGGLPAACASICWVRHPSCGRGEVV